MTLGVVVPCFRQERWLPRTLPALERSLAGRDWHGVLVVHGGTELPAVAPAWRVLAPRPWPPLTPGGARMLGLAAVPGEWVLFVDADTEVDAGWVERALAAAAGDPRAAGFGGRIAEWVTAGGGERPGDPDLNRVGDEERDVELLTTPALYRRAHLLAAGGYDPRLSAEEDFELGLRLASAGHPLRLLRGPAGRHWNDPRPSLAELARRWRVGLVFGPGQALRLYLGRPGFGRLLGRQRLPLAALGLWALGVAALARAAAGDAAPLQAWFALAAGALAVMTVRKRSARLAVHSVLAWSVNGFGLLVGFLRTPRAGAHAGRA